MKKYLYILNDNFGSQEIIVCEKHSKKMPNGNGKNVKIYNADNDCECDFCVLVKK